MKLIAILRISTLLLSGFLTRQTFAQTPELIIPSGHSAWITDAAVSRDGKYFVTGSYDNTVKIWDYASRREVKTLYGHTGVVYAIAISPNNQLIASASSEGDIRLWQVNTGQLLKTFSAFDSWISSLDFSPDSKLLAAVAGRSKRVFVHELEADSLLWWTELEGEGGKPKFFPDGKQLAVLDLMPAGKSSELSIYNANTGAYIPEQSFSYIHGDILDYDISATGRYIFSIVNTDSSNVRVHDMFTRKDIIRFPGYKKRQGSNFISGGIAGGENDEVFYSVMNYHFPQSSVKSAIKSWNWKEKRCIDSVEITRENSDTQKLIFSEKHRQLVLPMNTVSFGLIGEGLKQEGSITGHTKLINDFHEFSDGRFVVSGDDGAINEINTGSGTFRTIIPNPILPRSIIYSSYLLPDSNSLIVRSHFEKSLFKIDLTTKNVTAFSPGDTIVRGSVFDSNTKRIASLTRTKTGNLIAIMDENGRSILKREFGDKRHNYVNAATFLPNQKLAFRILSIDSLIVWDISANTVKYFPDSIKNNSVGEVVSFGNDLLLEGDSKGRIFIRNSTSFKTEKVLLTDSSEISNINIDGSGQKMLSAHQNGKIYLWDMQTMEVINSFSANKSWVTKVGFTRLPDVIYSYGMDNAMHFWDVNSGQEMASITLLDTIQHVISGPGGLFDASPAAMNLMYYVVNDTLDAEDPWKIIELNQLKHRYYQPGLLQIQLGYSDEKLRKVPALETIELAPKVKIRIVANQLNINLKNQRGGIGPVAVYLDGAELTADARPSGISNASPELSINYDLKPWYSRIIPGKPGVLKVIAWNRDKWISSSPDTISFQPPASSKGSILVNATKNADSIPPKLYAVVFGTSDYTGKQIDLSYSSKDAIDFANALKLTAQNLFGAQNTEVILFNSDETEEARQPDKRNFIASMTSLEKKMKPWDILVVYLSGHGVNYGGADGDFYYLTRQASGSGAVYLSDPQVRNNVAISSIEMTDLLNKISAKKKILILDACASGKAAETMLAAVRDVPASQVRALDRMRDRTGFYILSGSASDAVSYESSVYGQGLLTYSLLKAMRGAALRIDGNEEFLDVQKLLTYAVDEVPQLASGIGGTQKPLYRSPDDQRSFDIGKVDEKTKKAIVISEPKPVFLAAGFQDPLQLFDDLGLSEKINASFREITAKGKSADFIFTEAKDYPGAYRINGTYEKKGNNLLLRYVLTRDKSRVGDIRVFEYNYSKPELFISAFINELKENSEIN